MVSRVTPPGEGGRAMQHPPVDDVLEQSPAQEAGHDRGDRHRDGAGVLRPPDRQKGERPDHIVDHHHPVMGGAVDHPIDGVAQRGA